MTSKKGKYEVTCWRCGKKTSDFDIITVPGLKKPTEQVAIHTMKYGGCPKK